MKTLDGLRQTRSVIIICVALFAVAALPLLTSAQPGDSITIVNHSNRDIRHVYFAHGDDWV